MFTYTETLKGFKMLHDDLKKSAYLLVIKNNNHIERFVGVLELGM